MKKIIISVLIVASIVFVLDFAIGKTLSYFYFTQSSGFQYRMTYAIQKTNEDILIVGSSRANHHYVPKIFEDSLKLSFYNTGIDGQFILFQDAMIRCITNRYTPKYLILDFNDDEFVYSESNYDRLSALLPYYSDYPKELKYFVDLKNKYEQIKLISKIYPYNSSVLSIAIGNLEMNKERKEDFKGYVPLKGVINTDVPSAEKMSDKIDSNNVNAFKDFLSVCREKGVKVFVVVSPYYNSENNSASINKGSQISKEMNVPFFDYSTDAEFVNNKQLFRDVKHLNEKGAEIFSRKLVQRIKYTTGK